MKKAIKEQKASKNIIKKNVKHEDCKNVLLNKQQIYRKMKAIRSKNRQLGSYELNKVSLSCCDDKWYIHMMV